jgi:DNA repair protein RecN (Recombination protein N)
MIEHLVVRDFALIESAEVDLPGGFVVFSGETGAGKSLVVEAIGFLFGARADSSVIREGAEECSVSGTVNLRDSPIARNWLEKHDIANDDGKVNLRRGFRSNGRSFCYIQNQSVSRNDLADFTSLFADIHGQHEHQQLMNSDLHGQLLDSFAGLEDERAVFEEKYRVWVAALQSYRAAVREAEAHSKEKDYLEFVVKEIEAAKLSPGEEESLLQEERILSQHEKLFAAIQEVSGILNGSAPEEGGVVASLRKACSAVETAGNIDSSLSDVSKRLSAAFFELEDIAESVNVYRENLRFDPDRQAWVEGRLAELRRLKKKYGASIEEVLARAERSRESLAALSTWDDNRASMEKEIRELQNDLVAKAQSLSEKRKSAAKQFSSEVEAILAKLGMESARLHVAIDRNQTEDGKLVLKPTGMDNIEFMIAPNFGESPRALTKIASGGELSRVALAIKAVLASKDAIPLLIFDEIDTGIGGEVAVAVGSYLQKISRGRQVLCVTHLASIAAYADSQFKVEKQVAGERTVTNVYELSASQRQEEIARMLAGDRYDQTSLMHAAEMLNRFSPGKFVQGVEGE